MNSHTTATLTETLALVIGQSHTEALSEALAAQPDSHIRVINYNRPESDTYRKGVFDPRMVAGIEPSVVVSMISGNFHNVLGLIEYPTRFNFMDANDRAGDVDKDRVNIPYAVMFDYLNTVMRAGFLQVLLAIRDLYGVPVHHVCSPPPHPDSDFIKENPGGYFSDKVHLGVSPPPLRLKLYTLHSRIFREFCEENGIGFIPPPAEAVDADGFLAEPYWRRDPTHANAAYGALVARQINDLLGL
ncbi:hypothetical protein [Asticcacaulis solisilvae]|uniref:hypothetical protein n=1 Tax=Asticcacaulis solisilvae TaxID=1217274 RepID=UPI003FD7289F